MSRFTWRGVHYETLQEFNKAQAASPSFWEKKDLAVVTLTSPEERQRTGLQAVLCVKGGRRPCILTVGCAGTMTATLRRYVGHEEPELFWMCEVCKTTRKEARRKAKWDPRALAVLQVQAEEEELARKALANDGTVPKIVQAAALIDGGRPPASVVNPDDEAWSLENQQLFVHED